MQKHKLGIFTKTKPTGHDNVKRVDEWDPL